MVNIHIRRAVLLICGTAFGFFTACSALSVNKNKNNNSTESRENLEERLDAVNSQISKDSNIPRLHLEKGRILNELAHKEDSARDRLTYYSSLHHSLNIADSLYSADTNADGKNKVDELLQVSWSNEHNEGVRILQSDSTLRRSDLDNASAHFQNAITIIPDSTISYKMKARAHYRNQELDQAITTLENARKRVQPLPSGMLEQLAFMYLESNQNQKAVQVYEEAESFSENNLNLLHGLANAYILADEHLKAVDLLSVLVDNEPENVIYRQAYGNELYFVGKSRLDSLQNAGKLNMESFSRIDSLFNRAGNNLEEALSMNPDNSGITQNLAFFHHNYATQLQQVNQSESTLDSTVIKEKINEQLNRAVPLLEELARREPDNIQYWKSLYQAYSYLGQREKAEEAKSKINS